MIQVVRTVAIRAVTAAMFGLTVVTGFVAGLVGAVIRAQLPDPDTDAANLGELNPIDQPPVDKSRESPALNRQTKR